MIQREKCESLLLNANARENTIYFDLKYSVENKRINLECASLFFWSRYFDASVCSTLFMMNVWNFAKTFSFLLPRNLFVCAVLFNDECTFANIFLIFLNRGVTTPLNNVHDEK